MACQEAAGGQAEGVRMGGVNGLLLQSCILIRLDSASRNSSKSSRLHQVSSATAYTHSAFFVRIHDR